jgi:6-pyruvoyltetrahydropterin/6-carboxytetrahydropterin synthase
MSAQARVTRLEHFSAGHRLFLPDLSEKENLALFGPCSNPGGHGHNYRLEVTVAGPIDPRTGMVLDLKRLHEVIQRAVLDKVDHRNLNQEVDFLRDLLPTTENLARTIFEQLAAQLPAGRLLRVRIQETDKNSAEYEAERWPSP